MNKIINRLAVIIIVLIAAMGFNGCKKSFLDITPKSQLIAQRLADYDNLLNNLSLLNTTATGAVPMGDEAIAADPYFSGAALRTQRLFRWDAQIYDPSEAPNETSSFMPQLYTFNKVINEVRQAIDGTDSARRSVQADAYAGRAWVYFMLANYYGKPYNAATASKDLAFPIITTANVTNNNFQRASVQEMYDTMITNLKWAIPYINTLPGINLRMSKSAAEALLGKIYVFMGNYQAALPLFNAAFTDLPVASLGTKLYDLNVTMLPDGEWGYDPVASPVTYTWATPNAWVNLENIYGKQFINYFTYNLSDVLVTKEMMSLFGPTDQRLKFYSSQPDGGGSAFPASSMRRMGPISAQYGVTLPELYLLQAECNARVGNLDAAKTGLETFRKTRMPAADASVTYADQPDLVRFVINERKREFALQGYRWFDMRRLFADPLFAGTTYTHTYIKQDGTTATYTLTTDRLVMKIPPLVLSQNPGFTDNP